MKDVQQIWTSGLWLAAKVNGEVRAAASDYPPQTDFVGSRFDESGNPYGNQDTTFRVFKISLGDNEANNTDYAEWPLDFGAPVKENGLPLIYGNQTLWCCFTDAIENQRNYNICSPLFAEIHFTVWGTKALDNIIFLRWEIFNKSDSLWRDSFVGFFVDADIGFSNNNSEGYLLRLTF